MKTFMYFKIPKKKIHQKVVFDENGDINMEDLFNGKIKSMIKDIPYDEIHAEGSVDFPPLFLSASFLI